MPHHDTRNYRRNLFRTAITAASIATAGCTSGVTESDFCLIAVPIHDSPLDTAETRAQVNRHNSDWVCRCEGDCE